MKELSLFQYALSRFKQELIFIILAGVFSILIVNYKAAAKDAELYSVKGISDEASADFPGGYKLNFIKWTMQ
jgi:hypothetical protein